MSFYLAFMTTLTLQSKIFQSLSCAQSAPLFAKKHQENIQSPYSIL